MASMEAKIVTRPDKPGNWNHRSGPGGAWSKVIVDAGPASGLYCRWLRQGGSERVGYSDWSGEWISYE
jgi:hypothetical protein